MLALPPPVLRHLRRMFWRRRLGACVAGVAETIMYPQSAEQRWNFLECLQVRADKQIWPCRHPSQNCSRCNFVNVRFRQGDSRRPARCTAVSLCLSCDRMLHLQRRRRCKRVTAELLPYLRGLIHEDYALSDCLRRHSYRGTWQRPRGSVAKASPLPDLVSSRFRYVSLCLWHRSHAGRATWFTFPRTSPLPISATGVPTRFKPFPCGSGGAYVPDVHARRLDVRRGAAKCSSGQASKLAALAARAPVMFHAVSFRLRHWSHAEHAPSPVGLPLRAASFVFGLSRIGGHQGTAAAFGTQCRFDITKSNERHEGDQQAKPQSRSERKPRAPRRRPHRKGRERG
jgi:hypothetical protein